MNEAKEAVQDWLDVVTYDLSKINSNGTIVTTRDSYEIVALEDSLLILKNRYQSKKPEFSKEADTNEDRHYFASINLQTREPSDF